MDSLFSVIFKKERKFPCDLCGGLVSDFTEVIIHPDPQLHSETKEVCINCLKELDMQMDVEWEFAWGVDEKKL